MSADPLSNLRLVDVTAELQAVAEFMQGAPVERKLAVCTWALDFLGRLTPAGRAQIVEAARQAAQQLKGGRVV